MVAVGFLQANDGDTRLVRFETAVGKVNSTGGLHAIGDELEGFGNRWIVRRTTVEKQRRGRERRNADSDLFAKRAIRSLALHAQKVDAACDRCFEFLGIRSRRLGILASRHAAHSNHCSQRGRDGEKIPTSERMAVHRMILKVGRLRWSNLRQLRIVGKSDNLDVLQSEEAVTRVLRTDDVLLMLVAVQ